MSNNSQDLTLEEIIAKGVKLTPMMEQYYEIKKEYKDILLMFRMGDFYELFFEDAKRASKILNISLTHRGKLGGYPIPMSGIPHHAANTYIDRITSEGEKVAICEQIEDPKLAKGIVKRAVTQVVSPCLPYDLEKSDTLINNYIACLDLDAETQKYNLIFVDFTTGDFFGISARDIGDAIEKLQVYKPKELICYLGQWEQSSEFTNYLAASGMLTTYLSEEYFQEKFTELYIERLIPTFKRDEVIKLHGNILAPIGAISYYICSTQSLEKLSHIKPFSMINIEKDMKITYPTMLGLEIMPKSKEQYKDSILGFLDVTKTSMGSRKLKAIFRSPLRDESQIQKRFNNVELLINEYETLQSFRNTLFEIRDIERIMAKVSTGKVNGSDLINLSLAVTAYKVLKKDIKKIKLDIDYLLDAKTLKKLNTLEEEIQNTINDEIGATLEKGNLIKDGCDKQRDKLRKLTHNAVDSVIELEKKYREQTGIGNLKIKSNNVAGYFIEVSKSHTKKIPEGFVRRQTLVNSERYQTDELIDFEKEVVSAKDKLYRLERKIFDGIVSQVVELGQDILNLAGSIAYLDVIQSFAWVSKQNDFSRPIIKKEKLINLTSAWHPLIRAKIKDQFVCHNLSLNKDQYFGLITGPNMAGKTTVMREVAIIQFLCQIGCFVPAKRAEISLADYIFSRLGASDDIIKGQSTFMVEMSETAEIIRHASEDSLIVLDEIGRGTSTYDGLSIAWSLVEYFVTKTKALTLFSTHYHELIGLVENLSNAKNLTVKTINERGNVQFLYELIEQGATQSFGIHVAKLAGLPEEILERSSIILEKLEDNKSTPEVRKNNSNQLDMFFSERESKKIQPQSNFFEDEIKGLDILNMTPIQALQKLHELKSNSIV